MSDNEIETPINDTDNDADDEDYNDYTLPAPTASTTSVTPDVPKFVACVALSIVTAFLVLSIEIIPPQSFPRQTDSATLARTGLMYNMQNVTADQCNDFYDYACGQYDSRYSRSNLFMETSNQIRSILSAPAIDRNITGELSAAGFYGCFSVQIAVDFNNRERMAVYLSPYNDSSNNFTIFRVGGHLFPPDVQVVVNRANEQQAAVYWLQSNHTLTEWLTCNATNINEEMFNAITNQSDMTLATQYYDLDTTYALPNQNKADVHRLVEIVRARSLSYVQNAPWLSEQSRVYLKYRLTSMNVFVGGPQQCALDLSLYSCLRYQHTIALASLASVADNSLTWAMSAFDVNAEYSPTADAIYIPWAIAQVPFYSPDWSDLFKLATLGSVIAHEIGHYVDTSPFNNNSALASDLSRIQTCLIQDYDDMGSTRAIRTITENWADFWGINTVALPSTDFYVLWGQIWCDAGAPRYITNSTDEHSSAYLRVAATLNAFPPFFSIMNCPLKRDDLCV